MTPILQPKPAFAMFGCQAAVNMGSVAGLKKNSASEWGHFRGDRWSLPVNVTPPSDGSGRYSSFPGSKAVFNSS